MATDVRKATLSLAIDSRGARTGAREFEDATNQVTKSATTAASSIDSLIRKLTALGAAYLGFRGVRDAVREFAAFELKLAEIGTMLDQQTMHLLPGYSKQLRSLSIEMGESVTTLSKGLYDIISACIPADKAMQLLEVSAKAARAGISDTGVAADALTTVLNSYGLSVDHAAKISSDMFETIFHGKVIFPELAHSIGHVASMAAAAGLSFEELMAAIATLTRGGIQADLAITGMKNILMEFLNPSAEAVKAAEQLGFEFNTATLHALQLSGVLEKMEKAGPELVAKLFGDMRANVAITALRQQLEGFRTDIDYIVKTSGADLEALDLIMDSTSSKMDRFNAAMADLRRVVASTFAPALGDIGDTVAQWIKDHQDKIDYYASVVQIHVERIKNTFVAFANYLRHDFSNAADVAWEVFLNVMEIAGKQAVRLAIKIGKGIWQGIRDSILGGDTIDENVLRARTMDLYKRTGGLTHMEESILGVGFGGHVSKSVTERPNSPDWYAKTELYMRGQMRREMEAQQTASILDQVGLGLQEDVKGARAEVKALLDRVTRGGQGAVFKQELDRIAADTNRKIAEAQAKLPSPGALEVERQMEGRRLFGDAMRAEEAAGSRSGLTISPKFRVPDTPSADELMITEAKRRQSEGQAIFAKYKQELDLELSLVGMTNAERDKTLLIEEAKAAALRKNTVLTQEELDRLEESMDKIEEARRLRDIGDEIGYGFARGFSQATMHARKLSDVLDYLGDAAMNVIERIMEIMIWEPMAQNISGLITGRYGPKTTPAPAYSAGSGTLPSAWGNAFLGGRLQAFGLGGIVDRPTYFQHAGGLGVAGEIGTEGIFPLKRTANGELGIQGTVQATAPSVAINIQNSSGAQVEASAGDVRFDGQRLVIGMLLKDKRTNGPLTRSGRRS